LKDYEEEKGEKHCAHFTWRDWTLESLV
jgi:hypothetical protein